MNKRSQPQISNAWSWIWQMRLHACHHSKTMDSAVLMCIWCCVLAACFAHDNPISPEKNHAFIHSQTNNSNHFHTYNTSAIISHLDFADPCLLPRLAVEDVGRTAGKWLFSVPPFWILSLFFSCDSCLWSSNNCCTLTPPVVPECRPPPPPTVWLVKGGKWLWWDGIFSMLYKLFSPNDLCRVVTRVDILRLHKTLDKITQLTQMSDQTWHPTP